MANDTPPPNAPSPGDPPPSGAGSRAAVLLPLALGLILAGVLLVRWAGESLRAESVPEPLDGDAAGLVTLTLERPDAEPISIDVPWRPGDTVQAATLAAGRFDTAWRSAWRGDGEMAFLTSLGGVENGGAAGRNWLFRVNGDRADRGAGAYPLEANDRVLWEFAEYE